MANRQPPKNKKPEKIKDSQVTVAIITGAVALCTVLITAIGGPVILRIIDRTPVPASTPLQLSSTQISPAATLNTSLGITQASSTALAAQYPISLSVDARVKFSGLGEVIYEILGAQLDLYNMENLSLTFLIRMTNNGNYDVPLGWSRSKLRLLADGVPIVHLDPGQPYIVHSESAMEEEFVFVFPSTTRSLVLRISHYDESTDIPVNLNSTSP